jgi:histone acetyltransferase 1
MPPKLTMESTGSTDSNKAVNISLVTPGAEGLKTLHSFNPKMTYAIFGEEESIFGYQGLKINLRYNACDMRPGLQITYSKKFKTVGETNPTDLKPILEEFIPKSEHILAISNLNAC